MTCTNCLNESVTFDPYNSLSLPIPLKTTKTLTVFVQLLPLGSVPVKFEIEVALTERVKDMKNKIGVKLQTLGYLPAALSGRRRRGNEGEKERESNGFDSERERGGDEGREGDEGRDDEDEKERERGSNTISPTTSEDYELISYNDINNGKGNGNGVSVSNNLNNDESDNDNTSNSNNSNLSNKNNNSSRGSGSGNSSNRDLGTGGFVDLKRKATATARLDSVRRETEKSRSGSRDAVPLSVLGVVVGSGSGLVSGSGKGSGTGLEGGSGQGTGTRSRVGVLGEMEGDKDKESDRLSTEDDMVVVSLPTTSNSTGRVEEYVVE